MTRLPDVVDFNELDHPALIDIFRTIDASIAALVASDPAFRVKPAAKRRRPQGTQASATRRRASRMQQAAA